MEKGADNQQGTRRVIKRYSNRKLYDTRDSRYVTLLQIAQMVRGGEDVQIIDNTTKEDKTEVTLALAISEELKSKPRSVPLGTLRELIQQGGEKILSSLREGAIGRLIPSGAASEKPEEEGAPTLAEEAKESADTGVATADEGRASRLSELVASSRSTLEQWQHAIDERIRAALPGLSQLLDIQSELRHLSARIDALEARLAAQNTHQDDSIPPPAPQSTSPDASEGIDTPPKPLTGA